MEAQRTVSYTTDYIYSLPDGRRAELIDGALYMMTPPNRIHQKLVHQLARLVGNYIDSKGGNCEIYPAPFAVFLNADNHTYVEPDLSVICDKTKLDDRGCNGAPDWIIEIVSPSSQKMDYFIKLFKYRDAGVREYWIVNPTSQTVLSYFFESSENEEGDFREFSFDEDIPVWIYEDLKINISKLLK